LPNPEHAPIESADPTPDRPVVTPGEIVLYPTAPEIASDGLPARIIKPHTHAKFDRHRRYCSIFNGGMHRLWSENRGYLELFASSGIALDGRDEVDGCPLIAAACEPPFSRMAFVEFNPVLGAALEERLRMRGIGPDRARVFIGDANDPAVLAEAMAFLGTPSLNFAFIDPEDINGSWAAIEFLASLGRKGQRIDFLINFPIGPMKRNFSSQAITAVLGTAEWERRLQAGDPLGEVFRQTYAEQFKRLGFKVAEHMEIRTFDSNTPVYDLVFASKDKKGIEFWNKDPEDRTLRAKAARARDLDKARSKSRGAVRDPGPGRLRVRLRLGPRPAFWTGGPKGSAGLRAGCEFDFPTEEGSASDCPHARAYRPPRASPVTAARKP
jgi:three-Cys-motif partner protein